MKNALIKSWLIVSIISGFSALMFFLLTYLNEKILCSLECRQKNEVTLILILMSLFGIFVGSTIYYFVSEKHKKEIIKINNDASATLLFLDNDNRKIIQALIKKKGSANQSEITLETGLSRVKISRAIKQLENKGIIKKNSKGMTNEIILEENLNELFVKN